MPEQEISLQQRMTMHNSNQLKIGLFGANCSSGRAVTLVPERWSGSWPDCLKLARMADEGGLDFMLPVGRWKGYGGDTDYQGATLETITWATGLLASTSRITVFGTVHAPLFHPIIAAKQFVTADQVGEGRFGLNIVVGWNEDEFEMFGVQQREHEQRYKFGQEWIDAIKKIWSGAEDFDVDGEFIKLKNVRGKPKPYGGSRPIIMNAGASPAGNAFAIRNCDAFFTQFERDLFEQSAKIVRNAKDQARQFDRELDVYGVGVITLKPTQKEAENYYRHCVIDCADWNAVDLILSKKNISPETVGAEEHQRQRLGFAQGMGGLAIVGDPDRVADILINLSRAGVRGLGISFVNYLDELPYFLQEVVPRLERAGVREKRAGGVTNPAHSS